MAYLIVENFSTGLDTRRMKITTKAGALLRCTNAHITRGGEIEKRKSFVSYASLIDGTFGLHAVGGNLYVFGSIDTPVLPTSINYQKLIHPAGAAMSRILKTESYNGQIYAIAQYVDGSIYHFYNGSRVTSWDTVSASVADKSGVAAAFALAIDQQAQFTATSLEDVVTITSAVAGTSFSVSKSTTDGGTDGTQDIVLTNTVPNAPAYPETLAQTIVSITGGSVGTISTLTINGVSIISGAIAWAVSNSATATALAANINAHTSSPDYTAVAVGASVTISAVAGSGSSPNGFIVAVGVSGDVTTSGGLPMTGGSPATAAVAEVYTAQIVGLLESADTFTIVLTIPSSGYNSSFTISASSSGMGRTAKTHNTKIYSTTRSLLYFCEINGPTAWGGNTSGAGFINISNEDSGSEDLSALGIYQGKLAVFSRRSIQIWDMDPDPTKNIKIQTLGNIGTYAPKSVVNFGDLDVFFLSDSGVRSLRARDSSNAATISDIGTNIDDLIAEDLANVSEIDRADAVGIIEPSDGRYMLAVGTKMYVYSYFPTPGISAWSTYETGFKVSDFAYSGNRIYARSGNNIYIYGGVSGDVYENLNVDIFLPFLDGGKPATTKSLNSIDMACEGIWRISVGADITNEDALEHIADTDGSTFMMGGIGAAGSGTHFGVRLQCLSDGYAKVGNFVLHFEKQGSE